MAGVLFGYFFIFAARICDVSLGTMRTLMLVRGKRLYAAGIGFFEVLIYITVLNMVISNLKNPLSLLAYAAGYATGNIIGGFLEEKLAIGTVTAQIITLKAPLELTEKLRGLGYGVTVVEGLGREGKRYILQIILPRKFSPQLRKELDEWDNDAFYTIFDTRTTQSGIVPHKGK